MKNSIIIIFLFFYAPTILAQISSGDIEDYIGNIIDNAPGSSGDNYVVPNTSQINTWNTIISFVLADNYN